MLQHLSIWWLLLTTCILLWPQLNHLKMATSSLIRPHVRKYKLSQTGSVHMMTSVYFPITRSESNRALLGRGIMADMKHEYGAPKSAAIMWCNGDNRDQNLKGMCPNPLGIHTTKNQGCSDSKGRPFPILVLVSSIGFPNSGQWA